MKIFKNIAIYIFVLLLGYSCTTDEDNLYSFDYMTAPANLDAVFDITQDNTGLVTILPNSEGAAFYAIDFGDGDTTTVKLSEAASHIYSEGVYQVKITAHGMTGLTSTITKDLNVTFKAPENLNVKIEKNIVNPRIVSVSATAKFATVMDIYFGEVADEKPVHVLPDEKAEHTYAEPGDYQIKVIAKSAGVATTEFIDTITIEAASDPINLPVDFESFTVNYAFTDFGGTGSSVVDNPNVSGINMSDKVGQSVKAEGAETWAGTILALESPIDFSVKKSFKVKVLSPKAGAVVKLKVENLTNGDINMEIDANTTLANEWEELTFDFSAIDVNNEYQKVVLFFDFGNVGDASTYHFDDIKLQFAQAPETFSVQDFEGTAPEFTEFGGATTEVVANPDATGINTTAMVSMQTQVSGAETWAGGFFKTAPLDLDTYSKLKVKTWSPKSGIVVKLKLENADASVTYEVDMNTTVVNTWEELTYDLSEAPAADYVTVVMFFDFGNSGDGSVYYFDEIALANDGGGPAPLLFQDFEGTAPEFTEFGGATTEVTANPDAAGLNTTAMVAMQTQASGAETWAGGFFKTAPLDLDTYSKIKVKTWSPKSGIVVKLKLENADASVTYEVDMNTTVVNAWEELTYDLSEAPAADYVTVVMFFDFGNGGDGSVYYFDQFELTN